MAWLGPDGFIPYVGTLVPGEIAEAKQHAKDETGPAIKCLGAKVPLAITLGMTGYSASVIIDLPTGDPQEAPTQHRQGALSGCARH